MSTTVKKDYELAIDAYVESEKKYKALEAEFLSGEAAISIAARSNGNPELFKQEWQSLVDLLKTRLEELNANYHTAKNAFRVAVALGPSQWRGVGGKASSLSYGPFTVESATTRSFNPKDLIRGVTRAGKLDRLLSLTGFDSSGKEYRLVEQTWKIDFGNVLKWLQSENLQSVIDGAYDEKEQTPRVQGAKPLAFLGEKIEK